jgi:protein-disulfide isomerase
MPLIDIAGAPELGSSKAALTLIEFADYECPFCIRHFAETMPRLEEQFIRSGQVRYVFRDLPIDELHPGAMRAHEAAHCAAEQGKFWELHRRLFGEPGSHGDEALARRASEAGLDGAAFDGCLSTGRTTSVVRKNVATAAALGAHGTPSFFLGVAEGVPDHIRVLQVLSGAQPYEEFQKVIATVSASLLR